MFQKSSFKKRISIVISTYAYLVFLFFSLAYTYLYKICSLIYVKL